MKNKSVFSTCLFLIVFLGGFFVVPVSCFAALSNANLNGEYIAISQERNGEGIRILLTFDGNGNGTFQHLESKHGDLDSGSFIYNVSSDGTFVLISEPPVGNGIITPGGEMGTISFIGDDNTNLTVFVKKSSGMSNSALNGQYIAVSHNTYGNGCRVLLTFDGNGNGTFNPLECSDGEEGRIDSGAFTYNVSSDGTVTFTIANQPVSHGIITADGTKGTMSFFEDDYINFIVFIKKSSGMSNSALNGQYIGINTSDIPDRGGCRTLVTFDGDGNFLHQHLECMDGDLDFGAHTYLVSSDGTFTWLLHDARGIISADGEMAVTFSKNDDDENEDGAGFSVCVKKSLVDYYPLAVENTWTYSPSHGDKGNRVDTIIGTETVNGTLTYIWNRQEAPGDNYNEKMWRAKDNTDLKIYQIWNNEGADPALTFNPPFVWMKLKPKVGDTWISEFDWLGDRHIKITSYIQSTDDTITVPAGTFTNCVIRSMIIEHSVNSVVTEYEYTKEWYAPDVGLIIDRNYTYSNWENVEISQELISFTIIDEEDEDGDGYTVQEGDCDDTDATIYPGAAEIPYDNIDQDCDGHDETSIDPPTVPRGLAANAVSYRKILLRWTDQSSDEDGFKIERKERGCNSSYAWSQIATVLENENTYDDIGFDPDTQYSYRVRAYRGSTNSEYSNCGTTVSGISGTPSAPVNLVAAYASSFKVDLSWDEWSSNVTGFKIYRDLNNSDSWTLLTTTGPATFNYSDTTATGNQSATGYCYYVQACNDNGCSPPTYTVCMPFNPSDLTATAGSNGKVVLSWIDNSDNERGFELYRKTGNCSSSASWEKVKSAGIDRTTVSDKKDLISGTTYSYKIRAYCRSWGLPYVYGYSGWSDCVSVTAP